jgi:hypothetical protein
MIAFVGCGPPHLAPVPLPAFPPPEPPAPAYGSRIVALRTTLGRAGIRLDTRGVDVMLRSSGCDDAALQSGCSKCDLAGESDPLDGAALEAITTSFDRYPTSFLAAADIKDVALCRSIDYEPHEDRHPAGTVDLHAHRLLISVEYFIEKAYSPDGAFTAEDIVHHELFHLIDYELMHEVWPDDPEWRLQNPVTFEYRKPNAETVRPEGFVNVYATTNEMEDRASVFEYLMARPADLCALAKEDAFLRAKTRLVWWRTAEVVGDAFLRQRATCVDWIDEDARQRVVRGPLRMRQRLPTRLGRTPFEMKDQHWLTPPAGR